ncbi:MAG: glycosyltransferase family 39 protein, partial [Sporomusaceae bacterium]|nr:glycosyltransferase family 39 protein [Sporomusaceae bacterium]
MKYTGFKFYLLAIFAAIIIFTNLGSIPLLDPDEPVYGQTPKEMIATGDYVSPRIYGDYWYDKPPMYYWLVAASYKIFGLSEFAARFPAALFAVLGLLVVYVSARKLFNERVAFSSALILLTSLEYIYLSKAAVTDMTLCFFLTGSLLAFLLKRYYWFYVFAALAVLTKGPIGILFPLLIAGIYILLTKQWPILRQMKLFSGFALFLVLALPWYLIMYNIHGQIFFETFFGFHNVTRFMAPEHTSTEMWYFFMPVLIAGFFPWSAALAQSVSASLSASNAVDKKSLVFLNIWAWFVFLFFTLSHTKLVSYILPMWPPLAIIAAWYIDQRWHDYKNYCSGWSLTLLVLVTASLGGLWYGAQKFPELIVGIVAVGALLT